MKLIAGLVRLVVRLALLPARIALALVGGSFKLGLRAGTAPVRVGWRATRAAGISGVACFALGVGIGLLAAPRAGRDLRAALVRRVTGAGPPTDEELADKVGFELGHAPRTWHLPQPEVEVAARVVSLRGAVPDESARAELVSVATAVDGVVGVDDHLVVEGGTA